MANQCKPILTDEMVRARRGILARYKFDVSGLTEKRLGIAFSGGGIRSATLSLGIAQALARRDRLFSFDMMSTVSGGGYFGCFFRSLFIPQKLRGLPRADQPYVYGAGTTDAEAVRLDSLDKQQFNFAWQTLRARPSDPVLPMQFPPKADAAAQSGESKVEARAQIPNPAWWLREQGRYLAPNGTADMLVALSHIIRNWFSMLYILVVAMAFIFLAATLWHVVLGQLLPDALQLWVVNARISGILISPATAPAAVTAILAAGVGIGYWMTEAMPLLNAWLRPAAKFLRTPGQSKWQKWKSWGNALPLKVRAWWTGTKIPEAQREQANVPIPISAFNLTWYSTLAGAGLTALLLAKYWDVLGMEASGVRLIAVAGISCTLIGLISSRIAVQLAKISVRQTLKPGEEQHAPRLTPRVRSTLTSWLARLFAATLLILIFGSIDTLALWLLQRTKTASAETGGVTSLAAFWVAIYPALAFLIARAKEWFSDRSKGIGGWLFRNGQMLTLLLGLFLYFSVAVIVDFLVQSAIWREAAWPAVEPINGLNRISTLALFFMVTVLAAYAGWSTGFINLSSLHAFYARQLSRAYLGASNWDRLERLDSSANPSVLGEKDAIALQAYQMHVSPAPAHLINVTLNETRGRKAGNITKRDRKGRMLTFGPAGVRLGEYLTTWQEMANNRTEALSVGQVCAISGAAASAGMGRQTSIGGALALTFANVRLGYWWDVGVALDENGDAKRKDVKRRGPAETFVYLANEATARYSLEYPRLYLTDGGHFENSGALALLHEDCDLIVVADNEQDEGLTFGALEILMRTARIDLGLELVVVDASYTRWFADKPKAASLFFNVHPEHWRRAAETPDSPAFALLIGIRSISEVEQKGQTTSHFPFTRHIIWMKPRRFANLPFDLEAYARANPDFPHQSTGDQFFEEQQWESYRRLGYEMASRLFGTRSGLPPHRIPVVRMK